MADPRLPQAPGGAGNHAAAGIGAHNHVGIPAKLGAALKGNLMAQCFDAGDAEGGIEGSIEEVGVLQQGEGLIEELGAHGDLHHLGSHGLAGPGLLNDLGLAHLPGVVGFLDDDALEALHRGLGGHGGAVVAGGRGDDALIAVSLGKGHRTGGPAGLKGAGGVGHLILHTDGGAIAGLGALAGQGGQVPQREERGIAHSGQPLHPFYLLHGEPRRGHHLLVVKGDRAALKGGEIHAQGLLHNFALAAHHGGVILCQCHHLSPPYRNAL